MANVIKRKARKNWKCSKCGKEIHISQIHYTMKFNYNPIIRRCLTCGFEAWENTSSYYLRTIGNLQARVNNFTFVDEATVSLIIAEIDELFNEVESNYYNLPDNLANSELGIKLEDRKNNLESAIQELEELIGLEEYEVDEVIGIVNGVS